jgi:hypothetical protein
MDSPVTGLVLLLRCCRITFSKLSFLALLANRAQVNSLNLFESRLRIMSNNAVGLFLPSHALLSVLCILFRRHDTLLPAAVVNANAGATRLVLLVCWAHWTAGEVFRQVEFERARRQGIPSCDAHWRLPPLTARTSLLAC